MAWRGGNSARDLGGISLAIQPDVRFTKTKALMISVAIIAEGGCSTSTSVAHAPSADELRTIQASGPKQSLTIQVATPSGLEEVKGHLVDVDPENTRVETTRGASLVLENDQIQRIRRDRGSAGGVGAGVGALVGVLVGGAVRALTYTDPCANNNSWGCFSLGPVPSTLEWAAVAGLVGGVIGGGIGSGIRIGDDYVFGAAPPPPFGKHGDAPTLSSLRE